MNQKMINAIKDIANTETVRLRIMPNVIYRRTLDESDVARVMYAYILYEAGLRKTEKGFDVVNEP